MPSRKKEDPHRVMFDLLHQARTSAKEQSSPGRTEDALCFKSRMLEILLCRFIDNWDVWVTDIFNNQIADKAIKDHRIDLPIVTALFTMCRLLSVQRLRGNGDFLDGLKDTIFFGYELYDFCCLAIDRYKGKKRFIKECKNTMCNWATEAAKTYAQVGMKKEAAESMNLAIGCKSPDGHRGTPLMNFLGKSDGEVWDFFRKCEFNVPLTCLWCGSFESSSCQGKHNLCGGCKNALYCSKECQMEHWKESHRRKCKKLSRRASRSERSV